MKKFILFYTVFIALSSTWAQKPITNIIPDYIATNEGLTYSSGGKSYHFGSASGETRNIENISGIIFSGQTFYYNFQVAGFIRLRRVNNSQVIGNRSLLWMEGRESGNNILVRLPYEDAMEEVLYGRTINRGTDNLFGNQGDGSGNNNNIERVDWIVPAGMRSNSIKQSGFAIFERGDDNGHDPFCIAAILQVDAGNNPRQYGPILRVTSAHYGNIPSSKLDYIILRKDQSDARLLRSAAGTQNRGGVFVSLQDLGVGSNQTIYGYSLFANDLPTSAQPKDLVDYTNTKFFPTNTSSTTGAGGIDFIAITGLFNTLTTNVTLPVRLRQWAVGRQQNTVQLTWQLDNAPYCDSVVIEMPGKDGSWTVLAALPGTQTTFSAPLETGSKSCYRLKIIEKNGEVQYTPVKCTEAATATETDAYLNVQPTATGLQVSFYGTGQPAQVVVTSFNGQQVIARELPSVRGLQSVSLPVNKSSRGLVAVTVITGNRRLQKKVLLNR